MPDDKYLGADIGKLKGLAELALGELYYAAAFDDKVKNKVAMFNVSLNYFNNVDRDNNQWFNALFARTWASMMISRFDSTLGTVVTLRSPFFKDVYFPELNIVEAVTYYTLCRYDMVNAVVENFFSRYPGYRDMMDSYLEKVSTKTGVEVYSDVLHMNRDAAQGKSMKSLPVAIVRFILNEPRFIKQYNHIKEVEKELSIIESSPDFFKNSPIAKDIHKKMTLQLANLRNEAGKWVVSFIKDTSTDLKMLIANGKAIKFEMTDREKMMAEKEELYGKRLAEASKKEEKSFSPAVPDNAHYWPFDGEYWEDELGYYFYNIESACIDK